MGAGTDVFVIGGGPVGLATAIAARLKGFSVVLADGCRPPIDKACGEGMLPGSLHAARRLGLTLPPAAMHPIRGIRFIGEDTSVASDFAQGSGYGVRRTVLHTALMELAARCGVELQWGKPIRDLNSTRARWIVGADGAGSRVRTLAGLDRTARNSRRYGFRRHFKISPWSDYVEIYWGSACQIYVTPIAPDEVGFALISRDPRLRLDEALRQFPELAARLQGAAPGSNERGGVTGTRTFKCVVRGNVALVGDASGTLDAITGEGLCLGFQQALSLADAMETGDLTLYRRAHRRLGMRPRFMGDLLLALDRWPSLRRRALPELASRPELFEGLLAMHTGASRAIPFAANCAALGWRMLTGSPVTS